MEKIKSSNQQELQKYLRYFILEKDKILKEFERDFQECCEDQVTEPIYNKEEVDQLLEQLQKTTKNQLNHNFQQLINMTGVYVDTILEIYEKKVGNADPINIDMAFLENKQRMDAMTSLEKQEQISNILDQKKFKIAGRLNALSSLGGVYNNDPALIEQNKQLTDENIVLKQKLTTFENLLNKQMKEKKDLINLKIGETAAYEDSQLREIIEALQAEKQQLETRIKKYEDDMKKKFPSQIKNLTKMIQQKNEAINELKQKYKQIYSQHAYRLSQYEPTP